MPRLTFRILILAVALAGCSRAGDPHAPAIGDAHHGAQLIVQTGCGACHEIPGIQASDGRVGPPLTHIGSQTIIAGVLPNTPGNMIRWIRTPQSVAPGNAMPDTDLDDRDARDVAAYLYTLR